MKASNKSAWFILVIIALCVVISCKKKELPIQNAPTFIKTYQTDSMAIAISLTQMPGGGFIIISSKGSAHPLMTRTDKYGNLGWSKPIMENGFQPYFANAFLLSDGKSFVAHSGRNIYKFDTLGNLINFKSIPNPHGLDFDDMSHLGKYFMLPACTHQLDPPKENAIHVFDENLNLVRSDSFENARIGDGGEIFGLFVNSISSTGAYNISGMKYLTNNPLNSDISKLFVASLFIHDTAKVAETIVGLADQKTQDFSAGHVLTNDSEDILLGVRSTTTIYYPVVVKFDKKLVPIWENGFPIYTASTNSGSVRPCKDGGFIMAGSIKVTGTTYTQPYILKIDKDGNKQWDKTISSYQGNGSFKFGTELIDGSLIFVGSTSQFGKGLNGTRILFMKTDANGNL